MAVCVMKAVHAIVVSMLGLKSTDVLFNLSNKCKPTDEPMDDGDEPYRSAMMFYYKYGWLCAPSDAEMKSFCSPSPE